MESKTVERRQKMSGKLRVKENKKVEDGIYKVKLTKWQEKDGKNGGSYYNLAFQIVDNEDFEGEYIGHNAPGDLKVGNKLYKILTSLNGGAELEIDETIDLDDYKGKKCIVTVTSDEDSEYAKIVSFKPLKKKVVEDEEVPVKKKVVEDEEVPVKKKVAEDEEVPVKKKVAEEAPVKKKVIDEDDDAEFK
jgi:hypothetical protein